MIDRLVDSGLPVKTCCRTLGVGSPGFYRYLNRPMSPTQRRRRWLTGLLRDYFPKGSDLSIHPKRKLETVAAEFNSRPRQVLAWDTPADRFARLLNEPISP